MMEYEAAILFFFSMMPTCCLTCLVERDYEPPAMQMIEHVFLKKKKSVQVKKRLMIDCCF